MFYKKKYVFFNIKYVSSTESCGALIEQMLRLDGYELQVLGNWIQLWSTELRGDRHERLLRTLLLSLEMWKGLYEQRWNIYKMPRNDYKDNFIRIILFYRTVNGQSLHAERRYTCTSRFFMTMME